MLFSLVLAVAVSTGSILPAQENVPPKEVPSIMRAVPVVTDVFGPVDERPVRKSLFERTLSKISCESFTLERNTEDRILQKSEIVQEIFSLLKEHNVVLPPDTAIIRFQDIDETDAFFESAQALTALGVLQARGGVFGESGVLHFELDRMLSRAFDQRECGFTPNTDMDGDGVRNTEDVCPFVPGTEKGCPVLPSRRTEKALGGVSRVRLFVPKEAESLGYSFHELTDIQFGDWFRAALKNPRTGKNLSESPPIPVK